VAPLVARLPASLAYRVACRHGDWSFRYWARQRSETVRNLRQVLGDELSLAEDGYRHQDTPRPLGLLIRNV
jgi:lauroyl/myristoyl acyltransferase